MIKTICSVFFVAAVAMNSYAAPVPTLEALPAVVSGQPGVVVGWGLSLTYTAPADWVVLNDSLFTGSTVYGTYKDYVVNEFVVAGAAPESPTLTIPFSLSSGTGLGEFDINSKVPDVSISGNIVVDYSIFSEDPNSPTFDPASFVSAGQASAPVTVNIVPEPRTFGLMFVAMAVAAATRASFMRRFRLFNT
ncbi:MAG: hypothetical protein JO051_16100 [Acidobacteriaceae bacterium]|nr:hypothetical protein [Acidobacteriaceae bacterium]